MRLDGKTALVTGGASGFGAGIARRFLEEGARVMVADVNADAAEAMADVLGCAWAAGDVGRDADVAEIAEAALAEFGRLDILVNNAGVTRDQLLLRMKPEDWDLVIRINLTGTFNFTSAVVPAMLKQRAGRIVNVASVMGMVGNPGQANYSASKAGVIGLTRSTAKEVASRGITVNAVAPGFIETAMTQKLPEAARAEILKKVPMGSVGQPEDVANGVLFLVSDMARYITGHVLVIDGGLIE